MPVIQFVKDIPALTCSKGAVLMETLLAAEIPVASSCHGKGVCSKCKVIVLVGADHLSPETASEQFLREKNKISHEYRISCQTQVHGDITIDAGYW